VERGGEAGQHIPPSSRGISQRCTQRRAAGHGRVFPEKGQHGMISNVRSGTRGNSQKFGANNKRYYAGCSLNAESGGGAEKGNDRVPSKVL